MPDLTTSLQQSVLRARDKHRPLHIQGGGSKAFLKQGEAGEGLSLREHRGIVSYQPTELVLTARAGTPLKDIEATLAEAHQMLPFEPPHFSEHATFGGAIASGLSGPARPFTGSARDFVLGCKIINGKGEVLSFGGQVMKNVAGYDVSRLMVGAMGTLGVLLEVSIKVLPAYPAQISLRQARTEDDALRFMRTLTSQNLPLTGLSFDGDNIHIRLAGSDAAVKAAAGKLGGEPQPQDQFWHQLNEQSHPFFATDRPLWRLSLPPASQVSLPGKQLIDWGGGLRWLKSDEKPERLFRLAADHGGHAWLFKSHSNEQPHRQPLPAAMMALHQKLKYSFDPLNILNPGSFYADF